MKKEERALRQEIIDQARWMNASGLNQGTSGNISARHGDRMLITPSATPYDAMEPEMIASMPIESDYGTWEGPLKPSTEWRFHLDIQRARPEVGAVVHIHSTFGTRELSDHALVALQGRTGCLLANHGMIATGATLAKAMWLAVELETIAKQYYLTLPIGGPNLLSEAAIADTAKSFGSYGLQDGPKKAKKAKAGA